MKLYVGNLPGDTDEEKLKGLFADLGEVVELALQYHHRTGEFLRYAVVEISSKDAAKAACRKLDGLLFHGRPLKVMEAFVPPAMPETPRSSET